MLLAGVVVGARGLKGEVRIKAFTQSPGAIGDYGPLYDAGGERAFRVKVTGLAKGVVVARIDGIDDRDQADALKGQELYVPRDAMPDPEAEEFYHADLIGLRADLKDGGSLGRITAVLDFGGGVSLEIRGDDGSELLVPFTEDAAAEVVLRGAGEGAGKMAGYVVIDPPPGLLEPAVNLDEGEERE